MCPPAGDHDEHASKTNKALYYKHCPPACLEGYVDNNDLAAFTEQLLPSLVYVGGAFTARVATIVFSFSFLFFFFSFLFFTEGAIDLPFPNGGVGDAWQERQALLDPRHHSGGSCGSGLREFSNLQQFCKLLKLNSFPAERGPLQMR